MQKQATDKNQISSVAAMDLEIRQISLFHAMTLNRILLSALLLLFELVGWIWGFHSNSSLYILAVVNLAPWLIEPLFIQKIKITTPAMPYIRKKYHYSELRLASYHATFFLTCCLLMLWQQHIGTLDFPFDWLHRFPLFLLIVSLLVRSLAPWIISRKIRSHLIPF